MSRDFPDELLSAYLDGELSPDERASVERHLASSDADRQLLDELRAMHRDLSGLPQMSAKPGFADRVVKAALAAPVPPADAASVALSGRRRWIALAAAVAGTAACALLFVRLWGLPSGNVEPYPLVHVEPQALTPAEQLIAALRASAPGEGEAAVLRLRLPKQISAGAALDAALHSAGIQQRSAAEIARAATALGAEYRKQVLSQSGPKSDSTIPAADALFIEAPLAQLEAALASLATDPTHPIELASELKLAFMLPPTRGEGEWGSDSTKKTAPVPDQPYAQHLQPETFLLVRRESSTVPASTGRSASDGRGKSLVRLLILVEQIDSPR